MANSKRLGQRREWLLMGGILLVAGVLRSIGITKPFAGHQDWHTAFYSLTGVGARLGEYSKWPPLTDWMYKLSYLVFGREEWAFRVFPIVCSLLTIWFVYKLSKDLFDVRTGLTAALLLAILPYDIFFARIESYHLFIVLTIWAYYRWAKTSSRTFLALAVVSNLIGLGFSYSSVFIVAFPIAYLGLRRRDIFGLAMLVSTTVLAMAAWFGYLFVTGSWGGLGYGVSADNSSWLLSAENFRAWLLAARQYLLQGFTPVVLALSIFWATFVIQVRREGDMVLFLWCAGIIFWLLLAPRHSSTHDIWWLILNAPLTLASARGFYLIADWLGGFKLTKVAYALLLPIVIAVGLFSLHTNNTLMRIHYYDPEIGKYIEMYTSPSDVVISVSPMDIWYSGARGYLWSFFGQVVGEDGFRAVLEKEAPAIVETVPQFRDWKFWGDSAPWAEPILRQYNYRPTWALAGRTMYLRADKIRQAWEKEYFNGFLFPLPDSSFESSGASSGSNRTTPSLGAWTLYDTERKAGVSVVSMNTDGRSHVLQMQSTEYADLIVYQRVPLTTKGMFSLAASVRTENVRGLAYVQLAFLDKDKKWLEWADSPYLTGTNDWGQIGVIAFYVPEGTSEISVNLRLKGSGRVFLDDIRLRTPGL